MFSRGSSAWRDTLMSLFIIDRLESPSLFFATWRPLFRLEVFAYLLTSTSIYFGSARLTSVVIWRISIGIPRACVRFVAVESSIASRNPSRFGPVLSIISVYRLESLLLVYDNVNVISSIAPRSSARFDPLLSMFSVAELEFLLPVGDFCWCTALSLSDLEWLIDLVGFFHYLE